MAEAIRRHRELVVVADYGSRDALELVHAKRFLDAPNVDMHPSWMRLAQALADIEAEALANQVTGTGAIVGGQCSRCGELQCLPVCAACHSALVVEYPDATRAGGVDGEREHLERGCDIARVVLQAAGPGHHNQEAWLEAERARKAVANG